MKDDVIQLCSYIAITIGAFGLGAYLSYIVLTVKYQDNIHEHEMDTLWALDAVKILLAACRGHKDDDTMMLAADYARETLDIRFSQNRKGK